ncbi:MAG: transaldolase [Candidatus Saganbacteria bacterium]|nr:transaldolase [Candidatus Saganbacteria bacterium]
MSRLKDLHKFGQSPWYDNIERGLLLSGGLKKMIDEDGISGLTSNPSIFEKSINGSQAYDEDIKRLGQEGKDTQAIYDELTSSDILMAADLLKSTNDLSKIDGFVSIEVSPHLAHDKNGTIAEAKHLFEKLGRKNLMIKVPATKAGIEAIRQLIFDGVNINATLIFTKAHYEGVAKAYIAGLEERVKKGLPINNIHSVASFFVSRIDSTVDKMLDAKQIKDLKGKAAVAQTKVVNEIYRKLFYGKEFAKLAEKGANIQRLLFGSTSTKDAAYSDVKYVEEIIGEGTVNTLPHATVDAFRDHGKASATLDQGLDEAKEALLKLSSVGISIDDVCQKLQDDGVAAFVKAYDKLIASLESKRN